MQAWHEAISKKYPWYAGWHQHPLHPHAHWATLVVVAILLTTSVIQAIDKAIAYAGDNSAAEVAAAAANHLQELGAGDYAIQSTQTGQPTGEFYNVSTTLPDGFVYEADVDQNTQISIIAPKPGEHLYVSTDDPNIRIENEYDSLTGTDEEGVPHAVSKRVERTGSADVIVTMKLSFQRYFDKNDTASVRTSKRTQFDVAKSAIVAAMAGGGHIKRELPIISGLAITINASALKGLAHNPNVESIAPDIADRVYLDQSANTVNAPYAWGLADTSGKAITGQGVRIAIIDTGVDYMRTDLGGCLGTGCKVEGGWDFANNDANPMDDHGHGTHVAATAAGIGMVGSTRLYGVAPGAHILAYKVCSSAGSCSSSNVIAAINRAVDPNNDGNPADHVDVISMSLGANCGTYSASCGPTDAQSNAVNNATAAGVVSAISAGNAGPTASTVGSPGTAATAVTVAAGCSPHGDLSTTTRCPSGNNTPVASFSSRGPVVYNGTDYKKPDITAPGVMICAARLSTAFSTSPDCFDSRHVRISGTSMAAPHIAGVLALLKQANPNYTPADIKNLVKSSATSFGSSVTYNDQGAGLVNVQKAIPIVSQLSSSPTTWSFATDPTTKYSSKTQDFTLTPNVSTLSILTVGFASPNAGITFTSNKTSVDLAGSATDSFSGTVQVDNDVVKAGPYLATITFTDSAGKQVGAIPVFINVVPTISVTPTGTIDYGVDAPNLTTWTSSPVVLTLTNLRTDVAQTVAPVSSGYPSGVTFTTSPSSLTVPAGGSATLSTGITVTNSSVANGTYAGTLALGGAAVNTSFTKFYRVDINMHYTSGGTIPLRATLTGSSGSVGVAIPNTTGLGSIYRSTAGTYSLFSNYGGSTYVFTEGISVNKGVTNVDVYSSMATHQVGVSFANVIPKTSGSSAIGFLDNNGFSLMHSFVGGTIAFSDMSSSYSYAHVYDALTPQGNVYTAGQKLYSGIYADAVLAPVQSNFSTVGTFRLDAPALSSALQTRLFPVVVASGDWSSSSAFSFATTTRPIWRTVYAYLVGSGISASAYALSYQSCATQGACTASFHSPIISSGGTVRSLNAQPLPTSPTLPKLPTAATSTVYMGLGPSVWSGILANTSSNIVLNTKWGYSAFLRQDYALAPHDSIPYTLSKNGGVVSSGTLSAFGPAPTTSNWLSTLAKSPTLLSLPASAGIYQLSLSFPYQNAGIALTAEVLATFDTSLSDKNPPTLTQLYYSTNSTRTDQYYTGGSQNTFQIGIDPNVGTLTDVQVDYSTDSAAFSPVAASGSGSVYTVQIPANLTGSLLTLRILATDSSHNSLRYTLQLPITTATPPIGPALPPPDTTAPITSITSPADGATLSGTTAVAATASDDVGVAKVELWKDGVRSAIDTASPYGFSWDTMLDTNTSHNLQTRSYDAAGNIGSSAIISVTIDNTASPTIPTASLSANPTSITVGQTSLLTWFSTNATSCLGVNFTAGTPRGTTSVAPTQTTTYSLSATGAGGTSATSSATVTVASISPALGINSRVKTTENLNVRDKANTKAGKLLCTQPAGATGTIVGGPSGAQGYTWWNINFDTSCDGWVVQTYLAFQ